MYIPINWFSILFKFWILNNLSRHLYILYMLLYYINYMYMLDLKLILWAINFQFKKPVKTNALHWKKHVWLILAKLFLFNNLSVFVIKKKFYQNKFLKTL